MLVVGASLPSKDGLDTKIGQEILSHLNYFRLWWSLPSSRPSSLESIISNEITDVLYFITRHFLMYKHLLMIFISFK